jgi:hypothetical protein
VCDSTNSTCDIECANRPRDVFVVTCNATDSQWHYHTNSSGFSNGNFTAEWMLTNATSNDFCRAGVGGNSDGIQGGGGDGEGGTDGVGAGALAAILVTVFALLGGAAVGGYYVYSRQQKKKPEKSYPPPSSYPVNEDVELARTPAIFSPRVPTRPSLQTSSILPPPVRVPIVPKRAPKRALPLPQSKLPPSLPPPRLPPIVRPQGSKIQAMRDQLKAKMAAPQQKLPPPLPR